MSETKTIEERLEKLEQEHHELVEHVYGAINSINYTLKGIKKDHYQDPGEGKQDELDQSIEEIEDSLSWIGELMEEEE